MKFTFGIITAGTYWVAKKQVMKDHPLDDNLLHCQDEDVECSKRVRYKYDFSMNPYSNVKSLKFKDSAFNVAGEETIQKLRMVQ